MKKTTLLFLLTTFYSFAQTIVSTSPENKKVILEEFTGIHCVYCPQGHAIANTLKNNNPNNVFLINVHVGGYSTPSTGEPDFRTTFGSAIVGQTGLTGYPAATVNRTSFSGYAQNGGTGTAMSRNYWTAAANQILNQPSYVNVATTASMDINTRVLTVLVEAYYTGNSPVSTNKLNVALLQNNTLGPQTGGNMGSEYNHQHRLVNMITGQWGEEISTTTSGTFVSRTYTYTVPASYNNIAAELGEFEVVAYVAETQQKIISGNGAKVTYTGLTSSNDAKIKEVKVIEAQCSNILSPKVVIQNNGQNNLTNLDINYSVNNGTSQTFNWTGNLATFESQTITLNPISYTLVSSNTLDISLASDDDNINNTGATTFIKATETSYSNITVKITTDQYGSETSWTLKNSVGSTVASSPTYVDQAAAGAYPQPDINLNLPNDCYTFTINDAYGDGMSSATYGYGSYQIFANGALISGISGGAFTSSDSKRFGVANPLGNEDFTRNTISLYPNPSDGLLTLTTVDDVNLSLIDITGKIVFTKNQVKNNETINVSHLQSGVYFAKLESYNTAKTIKIILN